MDYNRRLLSGDAKLYLNTTCIQQQQLQQCIETAKKTKYGNKSIYKNLIDNQKHAIIRKPKLNGLTVKRTHYGSSMTLTSGKYGTQPLCLLIILIFVSRFVFCGCCFVPAWYSGRDYMFSVWMHGKPNQSRKQKQHARITTTTKTQQQQQKQKESFGIVIHWVENYAQPLWFLICIRTHNSVRWFLYSISNHNTHLALDG